MEEALDLGFQVVLVAAPVSNEICGIQSINLISCSVFSTTFSNGSFRTARRTAQPQGNAPPRSMFLQLLPLFLLFGFSLLSALPSLFAPTPVPDPRFSYSETTRYNAQMETGKLGIHYYVNPSELATHPVIGAEFAREGLKIGKMGEERKTDTAKTQEDSKKEVKIRGKGKKRGPALAKFEDTVEQIYTQDLYSQCQRGMDRKERAKEAEVGLFGIGTDWDKVKKIEAEVIESCDELRRLGLLRR